MVAPAPSNFGRLRRHQNKNLSSKQHPMPPDPTPQPETSNQQPPRRGHTRRPPLAEIDSWELWQAWQRGERDRVLPWIALLIGFSVVLAAMYSFFFISSLLSQDTVAPFVLIFVL